jgi:hypothetical protein
MSSDIKNTNGQHPETQKCGTAEEKPNEKGRNTGSLMSEAQAGLRNPAGEAVEVMA